MSWLLTTSIEKVERARYLREVSEKANYNSTVIVKLSAELEAAEQLKNSGVTVSQLLLHDAKNQTITKVVRKCNFLLNFQ